MEKRLAAVRVKGWVPKAVRVDIKGRSEESLW